VIGGVDWLQPAGVIPGQPPGFPDFNLSNLSLRPRDPHDPHDPCTRPPAGSAAAVAGCAPPRCVIAPRPELEKVWLFGRRSRPPPAWVRPQTSRWIILNLAAAPCPPAPSLPPASPYSFPTGLTFLHLPSLPLE
jgi:hypothetical protein